MEIEIDCIHRCFLWKTYWYNHQSGFHLANWQNICCNKDQDGLGIINLRNFSIALKCKLLWYLSVNMDGVRWPKLVHSRYLFQISYGSLVNVTSSGASPLWLEIKKCFPFVNMLTSFSLGNGKKILFWENKWLGDTALKSNLSYLYSLYGNKKFSVHQLLKRYCEKQLDIFQLCNINSLITRVYFCYGCFKLVS